MGSTVISLKRTFSLNARLVDPDVASHTSAMTGLPSLSISNASFQKSWIAAQKLRKAQNVVSNVTWMAHWHELAAGLHSALRVSPLRAGVCSRQEGAPECIGI